MSRALSLARDTIDQGDIVVLSVRDLTPSDLPVALRTKNEIDAVVVCVSSQFPSTDAGTTLVDHDEAQWRSVFVPVIATSPPPPSRNHSGTTYDVCIAGTDVIIRGLPRVQVHRKLAWELEKEKKKAAELEQELFGE